MRFDLLIKSGLLVDPAQNLHAPYDVAIKRNRVAAVDRDIPPESAAWVIDAAGQIVMPGLVDLHTHVYYGVTFWGIQADPVAARSGVTTWLDVGSAGAFNLIGLRDYVARPSRARIYALLNISSIGLTAMTYELANLNYCDVELCCRLIDAHRDFVLGVKARVDTNTVGANGLEPHADHRARSADGARTRRTNGAVGRANRRPKSARCARTYADGDGARLLRLTRSAWTQTTGCAVSPRHTPESTCPALGCALRQRCAEPGRP